MQSKRCITILAAVFLTAISLDAAELTGYLTDSQTGDPVPGAMIKLAGFDISDVSNSEGKFELINLPGRSGELVITHLAYEVKKLDYRLPTSGPLEIMLKPKILKGQDVIITATRAQKGETPAAFSDLSHKEIENRYWAQDTPVLLSSMPNVYAYSDAGNSIGYSYMKIRGFDQKRISVMLNGIPLNDAESQEVYWIDMPDFASNVQDIQVQRGVVSSLYGTSAFGGSVNLLTNDFSAIPQLQFESGYGSYNSKKLSISGNSGLIQDSYVFYGRFSRIETDGYRDNSWSEMYSYFIGIARYDDNMTLKFNTYGGPEKSHLAYKGITEQQLQTDRKYNELTFDGEIDQFNQPHYELLHDWQINDKLKLDNTLYYFNGDGSYTQFRNRKDIEEYFIDTFSIPVTDTTLAPRNYYALDDTGAFEVDANGSYSLVKVDIIRRLTVDEYDWGWIPRLTIDHIKGRLTLGGEMRIHSGHHFGEVPWANIYPRDLAPDSKYYDYRGRSNTFTLYAYESYQPLLRLNLVLNLQYQRHNYRLDKDKRFDVAFDRSFDFFTPRAGIHYSASRNLNLYFSASTATRQPAFKDIYDPTDYWSNPAYKPDNFEAEGAGWEFAGPELNPEKLVDLEFGGSYRLSAGDIDIFSEVNLYWMQINDEIIPYAGQIDDNGYPISGNADKTLHQGIELVVDANTQKRLFFHGNFSLNDDHFVNYTEYGFDYDIWEPIVYDRTNKRIGGFPEALGNYRFAYSYDNFEIGLGGKYVGKQYIDNGEQYALDPHHILNGDISYNLGYALGLNSVKATLRGMNLTDKKYEQAAYIEPDDNLPRYIVGAERNFFLSLAVEF